MILGSAARIEPLESASPDSGGAEDHESAALALGLTKLALGHPAVFLDETNNRGYLAQAAEHASVDFVTLAMKYGTGALRVVASAERLDELGISTFGSAGHRAPVDLHGGAVLGIRAQRAATLRAFASKATEVGDLIAPGHVFPSAAGERLTLDSPCAERGAIEAMALAGLEPVAGYTEIVDHWGRPADLRTCVSLARQLELVPISLRAVIVRCESVSAAVERSVVAAIPTPDAAFIAIGYVGRRTGVEYVAFVAGLTDQILPVHVHRRCILGGVFGSQTCSCGERLDAALVQVRDTGQGVIIYRGGDDALLLDSHSTEGAAGWAVTVELASILHDLGIARVSLSSNEQIDPLDLGDLGIEAVASYRPATAAPVTRLGIANAGKNASRSVTAPSTNATV